MRSARMLLATATATAALAIAAPAAYAEAMGDWDHDTTSYSKEHHKDGDHHAPRGGVHAGGGALSAVNADEDWKTSKQDEGSSGDKRDGEGKHEEQGKEDGHEKGSWKGKHDKPHGGMHTGGGALAAVTAGDDWDSSEHGKEDGHEKGSWKGKHDKPHGGMHTGGGALASVTAGDDWEKSKYDPDTYKDGEGDWGDKRDEGGKEDGHEKGGWKGKHDKPRGGMHTGGGGLASAPGVTAGGLAVLAVAGTGLYALRRQRASQGAV
ncbi:hypothetical protein G3I77_31465 [Streptomyces sp. D2-8]|uniref:hypothetical protein n=1 Tax=Streptomyces sp. D2-8 TaxID=2707767 RepID=UPI0020C0532B|nr:hypothetical protein [Streptomyces sp. D2-8]MCK8437356.1 hypothetical protein [Streptomyces sp. D2-8]